MTKVKKMKVDGFPDAYRFWLRLCGKQDYRCWQSGGRFHYTASLSDDAMKMELTDKCHGKNVVGVIYVRTADKDDLHTSEIRFVTKKQRTKN